MPGLAIGLAFGPGIYPLSLSSYEIVLCFGVGSPVTGTTKSSPEEARRGRNHFRTPPPVVLVLIHSSEIPGTSVEMVFCTLDAQGHTNTHAFTERQHGIMSNIVYSIYYILIILHCNARTSTCTVRIIRYKYCYLMLGSATILKFCM